MGIVKLVFLLARVHDFMSRVMCLESLKMCLSPSAADLSEKDFSTMMCHNLEDVRGCVSCLLTSDFHDINPMNCYILKGCLFSCIPHIPESRLCSCAVALIGLQREQQ